jgi:hypothetical protein
VAPSVETRRRRGCSSSSRLAAVASDGSSDRTSRLATTARLFDRYWALVMLALAPLLVLLNLDAHEMQGLVPDYRCFANTIRDGFDASQHRCASPTFPMWGYGWVLLVTDSKIAVLLFQNVLAISAAWLFLLALERCGLLSGRVLRALKLLLVVSLPWYAFHSVYWPYSEAVSLVTASIAILVLVYDRSRGSFRWFALSGLAFGLALEFRSDYVPLTVLIVLLLVFWRRPRRLQLARVGVWLAGIAVALAPWMAYSYSATGHVLLTSTNAGHVLYVGLGQLPGNPWRITPDDGDPRMHRELDAHFGRHVSSLTYASDQFLRRRFVRLVFDHPGAYGEKVMLNGWTTISDGTYPGEFFEEASCQPSCREKYGVLTNGTPPWRPLVGSGFSPVGRMRYALFAVSVVEARLVGVLGYALAALALWLGFRRRSLPLALVALLPVFQLVSNAVGSEARAYNSNPYLALLVVVVVTGQLALARLPLPRQTAAAVARSLGSR